MTTSLKLSLVSLFLVACGGAAPVDDVDVDVNEEDGDPSARAIYLKFDEVIGEPKTSTNPYVFRFPD